MRQVGVAGDAAAMARAVHGIVFVVDSDVIMRHKAGVGVLCVIRL